MLGLGVLGRVFGTDKAAARMVETIRSAGDALFYTSEEKAADRAAAEKARAEYHARAAQQVIDYMVATSGQNLARRVITFTILFMWASSYLAALGMYVLAVWVGEELAGKLEASASLIQEQVASIDEIFGIIVMFYFAAPHLTGLVGAIRKRAKRSS